MIKKFATYFFGFCLITIVQYALILAIVKLIWVDTKYIYATALIYIIILYTIALYCAIDDSYIEYKRMRGKR